MGCGVCGLGLRGCPVSQYAKFIDLICKKMSQIFLRQDYPPQDKLFSHGKYQEKKHN